MDDEGRVSERGEHQRSIANIGELCGVKVRVELFPSDNSKEKKDPTIARDEDLLIIHGRAIARNISDY